MTRCDTDSAGALTADRHQRGFRRCWRSDRREARRATPTAPPAPPPPRARPAAEAHRSTPAPATAFLVVAALVGAGYGVLDRLQGGSWPSAAMVAGVAGVAALAGLYALHIATRIATQTLKIVIPVAVLLAIGNWLDWGWAEGATEMLQGLWVTTVEQAQALWHRFA